MHLARALAGLAVLAVAACGQQATPAAAAGEPVDPAALVGTWSVTGTAAADAVLTVDPYGFELREGADLRFGSWRAEPSGLFVAHVTGAGGETGEPPDTSTPPWLAAAATVTAEGPDVVLHDATGATTARLTPRTRSSPEPGGTAAPGPAAVLPEGLTPAERSRLAGRWTPAEPTRAPEPPHVELTADGAWHGSDGCNSAAGRWTAGADGVVLATSGPMTLMGCEGMVDVPGWLGQAARAGFDGETLVLLDPDGHELGRLVRA
jgi:heat shock protein HslJ